MSADWTLWPRDHDLVRRLDPLTGWTAMTLVERWNKPHTWTVTGPAGALEVLAPGMGMVIDRDGAQIASGKLRSLSRSASTDETTGAWREEITAAFVSDADDPWGRIVLPTPGHALTNQVSTFPDSHQRLPGGPASQLLWQLFHAQVGAHALAHRRLDHVTFAPPPTLGRTLGNQAIRLANLGEALGELAAAGALALDFVHDEPVHGRAHVLATLRETRDLTDVVRFGNESALSTGRVSSWSYAMTAPEATDVILAAGGELEGRGFAAFANPDDASLWGRRREVLRDRRDLDWTEAENLPAIADAGVTALADAATTAAVKFTIADGGDVTYRDDYQLGDLVAVDLPGLPGVFEAEPVREVTTVVTAHEPDRVTVVAGGGDHSATSTPAARKVARALHLVRSIERNH